MFITKTSMISGRQSTIWIEGLKPSMLKAWEEGALIQDALKGIPQEFREFIMTGISPEEWVSTFPDEDDEEEDEWDDLEDEEDQSFDHRELPDGVAPQDMIEAAKRLLEHIEADDSVRLFPK